MGLELSVMYVWDGVAVSVWTIATENHFKYMNKNLFLDHHRIMTE